MALKDLLKKREKIKEEQKTPPKPEFTFMRTTTTTQELIAPPSFDGDNSPSSSEKHSVLPKASLRSHFRNSSVSSTSSAKSAAKLLNLRRHSTNSSSNVPNNLPTISDSGEKGGKDEQAKWEERATILARGNRSRASTVSTMPCAGTGETPGGQTRINEESMRPPIGGRNVSDEQGDVGCPHTPYLYKFPKVDMHAWQENIQEAIKLHEAGDLERSTAMFGRLADTNAMAQILYGLALRHGWGISKDTSLAIAYLSRAALNSAEVESQALAAGMKEGGAAKGELVLAMYELANSFRHGWGVEKDPVAARSYYETAANLGDTDAMNEVARCYEEGFGGKKDKFKAAKYYRLAEDNGSKTLGNSWIWKDKYSPHPNTTTTTSPGATSAAGKNAVPR